MGLYSPESEVEGLSAVAERSYHESAVLELDVCLFVAAGAFDGPTLISLHGPCSFLKREKPEETFANAQINVEE